MTNINKPERETSTKEEDAFDGITFEVVEEEHTHEGQRSNVAVSTCGRI